MNQFARVLSYGASIALSIMVGISAANAQGDTRFSSVPFVAADSSDTTDFSANVVNSFPKRIPYVISANSAKPAAGTYAGVLITPSNPRTFRNFNSLSLSSKGSADIIVEFVPPDGVSTTKSVNTDTVYTAKQSADGYKQIALTSADFKIPTNSVIKKFVIKPSGQGTILVDDVQINDASVAKNLASGTSFFKVVDASPTGPLRDTATSLAGEPKTALEIKNGSGANVTLYLTLGRTEGCVQEVSNVIPGITRVNDLQGYIVMTPNQVISYTSPPNYCINGAISFNSHPANCPNGQSTPNQYPNGINLFEFILNNHNQDPRYAQETIDISGVHGVNCKLRVELSGGGTWNGGSTVPSISSFENKQVHDNLNITGVFPFGCTNCKNMDGAPICSPPLPYGNTCNQQHVCNVQRSVTKSGGTVKCVFEKFF